MSVFPVCHATLQEKMETLGKAANLAVFKPSEKITDDENSESDDSDVDDGTHCNVQEDEQDDADQDEDVINDDDDPGGDLYDNCFWSC